MQGKPPLPEEITESMLAAAFPQLSRRQCDVLMFVVRGKGDSEIGTLLFISPATVSTHVRDLLRALGVESRLAAAMQVVREIICRPDRWPQ